MAFNNAGIQVPPSDAADANAADEPIELFDRVTAVNQCGVSACMKQARSRSLYLPRQGGRSRH